jgi:hypothetical protein
MPELPRNDLLSQWPTNSEEFGGGEVSLVVELVLVPTRRPIQKLWVADHENRYEGGVIARRNCGRESSQLQLSCSRRCTLPDCCYQVNLSCPTTKEERKKNE